MFCTITPTRGDRPALLEFCKYQISRMTVKPDKSYFIDWKPQGDGVDIVARVRDGVRQALKDGFKEVYIVEDDDQYPADYFEHMRLGDSDFVGQSYSWYYNLRNQTYNKFEHPGRSSLFITGFKISALYDYVWPYRHERFLDISLWKHAKKKKFVDTGAIGIKHGIGLCGGKGHTMRMSNQDEEYQWLKKHVDRESYIFYRSL